MQSPIKERRTPESLGLTVLLALLLFLWCLKKVGDYDFFWHLEQGLHTLRHGFPPTRDLFSYTFEGQVLRYYEVLGDTLLAAIYAIGGISLVSVWVAAIVALTFLLSTFFLAAEKKNLGWVAGLFFFFFVLGSFRFNARPEIFSLPLMAISLAIFSRWHVDRSSRVGLALIPLQAIWANTHMGGSILIYLLLLFGFCQTAHGAQKGNYWRTYAIALLGTFLAGAINPSGFEYFLSGFLVPRGAMQHISEWAPMSWGVIWIYFPLLPAALLVIGLGVFGVRRRWKEQLFWILGLLLFVGMSFKNARQVAFLSLFAPFALAQFPRPKRMRSAWWILTFLILAFANAGLQGYRPILPAVGLEATAFPVAGVDFLQKQGISGRLFHPLQYGGYLIHRLFPKSRVFIDGRTYTLYPEAFYGRFRSATTPQGWEWIKKTYAPEVVILPVEDLRRYPFPVVTDHDFQGVYDDGRDVVWVARIPRFSDVIARRGAPRY